MHKIVVADEIEPAGLEPLAGNGKFKLVHVQDASQLSQEIGDAEALLVRSKTKVKSEILDLGKSLKFVGRAGVGVDNIDVAEASRRGVVVANVPGGNTISAAEHSVALLLALARNIPQSHASVTAGRWERGKFIGSELQGKTLGLVGFGRIGKEVAKRALSFEMKVQAYDPFVTEAHLRSFGVQAASLDAVLSASDFISLHVPVTDQTRGIIGDAAFAKMKPDCRLINCARGELIDEAALARALESKKIKGAALDVFSSEPPKNPALFKCPNLIATPHLGASTEEAQVKVAYELSLTLKDFFEKGVVRNAVNLPAVEPEVMEKAAPYLKLTEKLGQLLSQVASGGIQEIRVEFSGEFTPAARTLLNLSVVKGVLSGAMGAHKVNWVNAAPLAQERGIRLEESAAPQSEDFTTLVSVRVKTDKQTRSAAGTLLSGRPRIVRIDGFPVDVTPEGHLLIFTNLDRPGVVGFIGTLLGQNQINIASFQVGRKQAGGEAVSVLNVDSPIPEPLLAQIRSYSGITNVWVVKLLD